MLTTINTVMTKRVSYLACDVLLAVLLAGAGLEILLRLS